MVPELAQADREAPAMKLTVEDSSALPIARNCAHVFLWLADAARRYDINDINAFFALESSIGVPLERSRSRDRLAP